MSRSSPAPILFLDIDGVLAPWEPGALDPACMARLNHLVATTRARVVLASSWRETMSHSAVEAALQAAGASFRLEGAIPILSSATRGEEITCWLRDDGSEAPYVILDDGSDVRPHRERSVRPDADVGLTDADIAAASAILERAR